MTHQIYGRDDLSAILDYDYSKHRRVEKLFESYFITQNYFVYLCDVPLTRNREMFMRARNKNIF